MDQFAPVLTWIRRYVSLVLVLLLQAAWVICAGPFTSAATVYSPGSIGYDISWPQCITTSPQAPYGFGILGVTGGRAFTPNPCLALQNRWAERAVANPGTLSLYMNVSYASDRTASHGFSGPYGRLCTRDTICFAENFGWNAAKYAVTYAMWQEALAWTWWPEVGGTKRASTPDAAARQSESSAVWWLDVETGNTWSDNSILNRSVIRGAAAYLAGSLVNGRASGLQATVGIYSAGFMWRQITSGWSITGVPIWVAGAPASNPSSFCSADHAFGGGTTWLVQYGIGAFDGDYGC